MQVESTLAQGAVETDELQPQAAVVALGNVRRELARETGYAAYLVFPNASLSALAARLPRTMSDLEGIPGLGPKRIQAYGARILDAIEAATGAAIPDALAPPEAAVHHLLKSSETVELPHLPTLLEHVAKELRAGRYQLNPASPETTLQGALPKGTEFQGYHCQEQDGVITLVLRMKRNDALTPDS